MHSRRSQKQRNKGKIACKAISDAEKAKEVIAECTAQCREQDDEEEEAEKKLMKDFGAYWQSLRALDEIK